jgi:hypothetical protein
MFEYMFKGHKNPKTHSFKVFGVTILSFYYHNRLGWFRLFGKGLKWKDISIHGLIFSERNGYSKGVQIGKWRIGLLAEPPRTQSLKK